MHVSAIVRFSDFGISLRSAWPSMTFDPKSGFPTLVLTHNQIIGLCFSSAFLCVFNEDYKFAIEYSNEKVYSSI